MNDHAHPGEFSLVAVCRGFSPTAVSIVSREEIAVLNLEVALDCVGFSFATERSKPRRFRVECSLREGEESVVLFARGIAREAHSDSESSIETSKDARHDEEVTEMNVHR